jgi:GTP-binding protein LepA
LPAADPERVKKEIEELLVIEGSDAILASAKEGIGIDEILEAIVARVPPPRRSRRSRARPRFRRAVRLRTAASSRTCASSTESLRAGTRFMSMNAEEGLRSDRGRRLQAGDAQDVPTRAWAASATSSRTSDRSATSTSATRSPRPRTQRPTPLPGYKPIVPMVYCGLYPNEGVEVSQLREALEKLALNDSALHYEPESSIALGFGFRCGFLGLLHMEIVQERLERNYALDLIATSPSVVFPRDLTDGTVENIDNPAKLPARDKHRADRRAVRRSDDHHAARVRRRDHGAHPEPPRDARQHGILARRARDPDLRDAADPR